MNILTSLWSYFSQSPEVQSVNPSPPPQSNDSPIPSELVKQRLPQPSSCNPPLAARSINYVGSYPKGNLETIAKQFQVKGDPNKGFFDAGKAQDPNSLRAQAREETKAKRDQLGDRTGPNKDLLKNIHFFTYGDQCFNRKHSDDLLGRFDVVAHPATMDYDANWRPYNKTDQKYFWVGHQAALNIGENRNGRSPDFYDYRNRETNELDQARYVQDYKFQVEAGLKAASHLNVEDYITFPFGMGAFHAYLDVSDPSFEDLNKLYELKEGLAYATFEAMAATKIPYFHLCLPTGENDPKQIANYDAYLSALARFMQDYPRSDLPKRLTLYINQDATSLAQELANGNVAVWLVNGANRQLFGNHWDGKGANRAIDENMHRRSSEIAWFSACLNAIRYEGNSAPPCQYGTKCRRKNPEHWESESHVGHPSPPIHNKTKKPYPTQPMLLSMFAKQEPRARVFNELHSRVKSFGATIHDMKK